MLMRQPGSVNNSIKLRQCGNRIGQISGDERRSPSRQRGWLAHPANNIMPGAQKLTGDNPPYKSVGAGNKNPGQSV